MTNRGDFNRASCVMDVTLRSNFVATPIYHESPTAPWCTFDNNTAHAFIFKCERARKGLEWERDRSGTICIMPFRPLFYEVRLCAVCNSFRILYNNALFNGVATPGREELIHTTRSAPVQKMFWLEIIVIPTQSRNGIINIRPRMAFAACTAPRQIRILDIDNY